MSTTDMVKQRILADLERNRSWLDQLPTPRSVSIDVKFNEKTGCPRIAVIRTESEG